MFDQVLAKEQTHRRPVARVIIASVTPPLFEGFWADYAILFESLTVAVLYINVVVQLGRNI